MFQMLFYCSYACIMVIYWCYAIWKRIPLFKEYTPLIIEVSKLEWLVI